MSDGFFPQAPRPRGRGWWRRFRQLVLWITGGIAALALFGGIEWNEKSKRDESIRLAREGRRVTCTVVRRWTSGNKSTSYHVTIQTDEDPRKTHTCDVDRADYHSCQVGSKSIYYFEPGREGVAEIERPHREGIGGMVVCGILLLLTLVIVPSVAVKLLREMHLLRVGVELVTQGTGAEVRLAQGGRSRAIRTVARGVSLIRVGARVGPEGYVVLAAPDLSLWFFPDLRDVPVGRLARHEVIQPRLPLPVRPRSAAWDDWIRRKYRAWRIWVVILGVAVALSILTTVLTGLVGWGIFAGCLALLEAAIALGWMRRHWRDIVLWREGDEVHAVLLAKSQYKGTVTCEFAYTYHDVEYHRRESWTAGSFNPWEVGSPPDAAAITQRILILVDPYRPKRSVLILHAPQ